MTELIRLVVDLLKSLCPVKVVMAWEVGLVFFSGKYCGTVGPGLKLLFPGLMEIRTVQLIEEVIQTGLQTVTLRDGTNLNYSCSVTIVVRNAWLAYARLNHYGETALEKAAAKLSTGFATADPSAFDPEKSVLTDILERQRKELNESLADYGLEVLAINWNNFIRGARTIRLITDQAIPPVSRTG